MNISSTAPPTENREHNRRLLLLQKTQSFQAVLTNLPAHKRTGESARLLTDAHADSSPALGGGKKETFTQTVKAKEWSITTQTTVGTVGSLPNDNKTEMMKKKSV